jgi:hypothetical protein
LFLDTRVLGDREKAPQVSSEPTARIKVHKRTKQKSLSDARGTLAPRFTHTKYDFSRSIFGKPFRVSPVTLHCNSMIDTCKIPS